jgi:hypothetical protein
MCYILQPGAFWRRRLYNQVGGVNVAFKHCMDKELWLRFSQQTRPIHLPELLCMVRDHPATLSRKQPHVAAREDAAIREMVLGRPVRAWEARGKQILFRALRVAKKGVRGYYWARPPSFWSWMCEEDRGRCASSFVRTEGNPKDSALDRPER